MGRTAYGVKAVTLDDADDEVVSMVGVKRQATLLAVTEHGYGKRSEIAEYRVSHRGGKGIITIKTTERNGHDRRGQGSRRRRRADDHHAHGPDDPHAGGGHLGDRPQHAGRAARDLSLDEGDLLPDAVAASRVVREDEAGETATAARRSRPATATPRTRPARATAQTPEPTQDGRGRGRPGRARCFDPTLVKASSRSRKAAATPWTTISESTVRRLSHYYRVLEEVERRGQALISSHRLAEREGITSAQVRKDLSYFGSFGRRGLGYNVAHLRDEIRAHPRARPALARRAGRRRPHRLARCSPTAASSDQGFDVVAVFDRDPDRIGQQLGDLVVRDIARASERSPRASVRDRRDRHAGARRAQEVADALVGGRRARHPELRAAQAVRARRTSTLRTVDMTIEFESLSFALTQAEQARQGRRRLPFGE